MLKSCLNCAKPFEVKSSYYASQIRRGARAPSFCSIICHAESRKRGVNKQYILDRVTPEPNSGCWLWSEGYLFSNGYGRIGKEGAHVVSFRIFLGPIQKGMMIRHTCDNPLCVNPSHLLEGSAKDNKDDSIKRKRHAKGSKITRAVLTEELVAELKGLFAGPVNIAQLARERGLPKQALYHLKAGRCWRHVA